MQSFYARAREDVVVLDNGGCTIKAGLASNPAGVRCAFAALACALPRNADAPLPARRCSCVPNCTAKPKSEKRLYVGDEVDELRDISAVSIRRPVDRGFVVNLPLQKDIWERTLRRALKVRARFPSSRAARPQRRVAGTLALWPLTLRRRRWTPRNTRSWSRSRSLTCLR